MKADGHISLPKNFNVCGFKGFGNFNSLCNPVLAREIGTDNSLGWKAYLLHNIIPANLEIAFARVPAGWPKSKSFPSLEGYGRGG